MYRTMNNEKFDTDVTVVGAGYAGLSAAKKIQASGCSVVVLEARERVGGRVLTETLDDGTYLDLGGQWIGPTQDRIAALAKEYGVDTYPTYSTGYNLMLFKNRLRRYKSTIPKIDPFSLLSLVYAMKRLNQMAKSIPLETPWEAPNAKYLDTTTLQTWVQKNACTETAYHLLKIGLETVYACDLGDISLLHALFYIKSGRCLEMLLDVEGGAQQDRLVGGAQAVANRMAEALGNAVRLNATVKRIEQDEDGVTLRGESVDLRARRVIIAIPPTLAGRLEYSPAMPALRDQLTQRVPMGSVVKCIAVYKEPFWRAEGLSGQSIIEEGLIHVTFDNSMPFGTLGMLLGFAVGSDARMFGQLPFEERKAIVLESFARCFGSKALKAIHYTDKNWAEEPWSRGCYAGYMPTNVWTNYGKALRETIGKIHWAGTETSVVWNGFIEGAVESGYRAANEVLEAIESGKVHP